MKKNMRLILSLILKIIVLICSILGITLSVLRTGDEFMGGPSTMLFFTIQSNLWIGITLGALFILKIIEMFTKKNIIKKWMYIVKFIFTISISLTGVVYCFLLAPLLPKEYNPFHIASLLTHVIVPVCSITDLFVDEYKIILTNKITYMVLIPPLYYLGFSIIGYLLNWQFREGQNYPYFFLNFGCDAGLFGFIKEPLEIGCFYWMMLLLIIVLGMGFLYKFLFNKLNKE